jgi:hypothetical protein
MIAPINLGEALTMARELQNELSRKAVSVEAATDRLAMLLTYALERMVREERTRPRDQKFDQE